MQGLAVRRDRGDAHRAVLVADVLGVADDAARRRAWPGRCTCRRRAPRARCRRPRRRASRWWSTSGLSGSTAPLMTKRIEPDFSTKRLVVAVAVLGAGVGHELHAPRRLVVVRRLGRVADDEDDRVPPGDRERVLAPRRTRRGRRAAGAARGSRSASRSSGVRSSLVSVIGGSVAQPRTSVQPYAAALRTLCTVLAQVGQVLDLAHASRRSRRQDRDSVRRAAADRRARGASRGSASPGAPCRPASTGWSSRGVIRRGRPELDPEALGYPVTAFCTLEIRQGRGHYARRRAPVVHPRGAGGVHDHRGRRHVGIRVVARANADLQRVIDHVAGRPPRHPRLDGDRAGDPHPAAHPPPAGGVSPGLTGARRQRKPVERVPPPREAARGRYLPGRSLRNGSTSAVVAGSGLRSSSRCSRLANPS